MAAVMAAAVGIDLPHLHNTIARYAILAARGYGDLDIRYCVCC